MTDYVNTFGAATKDANNEIITAADIGTELDTLATAVATKADKAVPLAIGNIALLTSSGNLSDGGQGVPSGTIVGTTDTQTLTNKTLTSPTVNGGTVSGNFTVGATTISDTEISYLDGVTSNIQTQINAITAVAGAFGTVQIFTANGTYTKPAGLKRAKVTAIGGGGAGGGVDATGYANGIGGGGGGGGGWAIKVLEAGSIGATETVTIGAGGTGVAGGTGNTGGTTSLGTLCVAAGGVGGVAGLVGVGGAGGDGGLGTTGDAVGYGSDGTRGFADVVDSRSGEGGASILGGTRQGVTGVSATGNAGRTYGGGGSGAFNNTLSAYAGGAGAAGIIIVEEFY